MLLFLLLDTYRASLLRVSPGVSVGCPTYIAPSSSRAKVKPIYVKPGTLPLVNSQATFLEIKNKGYNSGAPDSLVLLDYTPGFRLHLDYHVTVLKSLRFLIVQKSLLPWKKSWLLCLPVPLKRKVISSCV